MRGFRPDGKYSPSSEDEGRKVLVAPATQDRAGDILHLVNAMPENALVVVRGPSGREFFIREEFLYYEAEGRITPSLIAAVREAAQRHRDHVAAERRDQAELERAALRFAERRTAMYRAGA